MICLAKLGVVGLCAGALLAPAHAQPAAEQPSFSVGDKWVFGSVADGKTSNWSREVVEVPTPEQLRVRYGNGTIADYDNAMNFMAEGKPEFTRVLAKYPMKVGTEWPVARKFANPSSAESGNAKVVAYEELTVPAGVFQCYRVEAHAVMTNKLYSEQRKWTRWYCPDVKWIAKEIVETKTFNPSNPAASGTTLQTSELVKFTSGK